jgi:hypothetical protein
VGTRSNGLGEVIRTRCYCYQTRLALTECSNGRGDVIGPLLLWYLCENMAPHFYFHSQKEIVNKIFSTRSSLHPQSRASGHTSAHVCQRTCIVSERRTGWSRKLLDIYDRVILLWVYKMVDVKYSRRGGTKVWARLKWSSVAMGTVSQPPVATVTLSSNKSVKSLAHVASVIWPAWQRLNIATGTVTASAHCYYGLLLLHIERYMISTTKWAKYYAEQKCTLMKKLNTN